MKKLIPSIAAVCAAANVKNAAGPACMITSMGKKKDEKAVHSYSVRTQVPENMVWLDIEADLRNRWNRGIAFGERAGL